MDTSEIQEKEETLRLAFSWLRRTCLIALALAETVQASYEQSTPQGFQDAVRRGMRDLAKQVM
jgi:hypothetical protein